jgi:hypothetical protein
MRTEKVTHTPHENGGPKTRSAGFTYSNQTILQADPDAATIVAAAFVIVAIVIAFAIIAVSIPMTMEIPVIGMIVEAHTRRAIMVVFGMPAIAIAVAGDIGGRRRCQGRDGAGGDHRAKKQGSDFHFILSTKCPQDEETADPQSSSAVFTIESDVSESDPDAAAIVAAAFVRIPIVVALAVIAVGVPVTMEIPVIRMIIETHAGRAVAVFGVPAIAIAVSGEIGRGRRDQGGQRTGYHHGAQK